MGAERGLARRLDRIEAVARLEPLAVAVDQADQRDRHVEQLRRRSACSGRSAPRAACRGCAARAARRRRRSSSLGQRRRRPAAGLAQHPAMHAGARVGLLEGPEQPVGDAGPTPASTSISSWRAATTTNAGVGGVGAAPSHGSPGTARARRVRRTGAARRPATARSFGPAGAASFGVGASSTWPPSALTAAARTWPARGVDREHDDADRSGSARRADRRAAARLGHRPGARSASSSTTSPSAAPNTSSAAAGGARGARARRSRRRRRRRAAGRGGRAPAVARRRPSRGRPRTRPGCGPSRGACSYSPSVNWASWISRSAPPTKSA